MPSHPFFSSSVFPQVLPGILTKHCCLLPDGNVGKVPLARDTPISTSAAEVKLEAPVTGGRGGRAELLSASRAFEKVQSLFGFSVMITGFFTSLQV